MASKLHRLQDTSGNIPYSPTPSHELVENGKRVALFTLDEVEALALKQLQYQKNQPKSKSEENLEDTK